jgi:hypothetical protein
LSADRGRGWVGRIPRSPGRWPPTHCIGMRDCPRSEMWVSHETIYQVIYLRARGNLRARQVALCSGRAARRPSPAVGGAVRSNRAWLGLNVSARPPGRGRRPGGARHWEGDLAIGKGVAPRRSRPWSNAPPGSSCWSRPWQLGSNETPTACYASPTPKARPTSAPSPRPTSSCLRVATQCPATTSTQGRSESGRTESCAYGLGRLA